MALNNLLQEPLERRSRGHAAAQVCLALLKAGCMFAITAAATLLLVGLGAESVAGLVVESVAGFLVAAPRSSAGRTILASISFCSLPVSVHCHTVCGTALAGGGCTHSEPMERKITASAAVRSFLCVVQKPSRTPALTLLSLALWCCLSLQAAAKLASGLVSTVWHVVDDMVVTPALQVRSTFVGFLTIVTAATLVVCGSIGSRLHISCLQVAGSGRGGCVPKLCRRGETPHV